MTPMIGYTSLKLSDKQNLHYVSNAIAKVSHMSQDNYYNLEQEFLMLHEATKSVSNCGQLGFVLVQGPSGAGKSTLCTLACQVYRNANIRHFVLPSNIASEEQVIKVLNEHKEKIEYTFCSTTSFGNHLGKFMAAASANENSEFFNHRWTSFRELCEKAINWKESGADLDYCPLVLLHDAEEWGVPSPARKARRQNTSYTAIVSLSPTMQVHTPLASALPPNSASGDTLPKAMHQQLSIVDDDDDEKTPAIFEFEGSGSTSSATFPMVMSQMCIARHYSHATDYTNFMEAVRRGIETGIQSSLVSFGPSSSLPLVLDSDGSKLTVLKLSKSRRKVCHILLNPAVMKETPGPKCCFHTFVHEKFMKTLQTLPDFDDLSINCIAARLLGIVLSRVEFSMQSLTDTFSAIQSSVDQQAVLDSTGMAPRSGSRFCRTLLEKIGCDAQSSTEMYSRPRIDSKKRFLQLFLRNCPEDRQWPSLCAKLILAAFSEMKVSLGCHATRDALRYSIFRVLRTDDSLTAAVRMDVEVLHHVVDTLLAKTGPNSAETINIRRCVQNLTKELWDDARVIEPGVAATYGNRFELCVFSRLCHCVGKAFEQFPNQFCSVPLRKLLNLGKVLIDCRSDRSDSANCDLPDFPSCGKVTNVRICWCAPTSARLCAALKEFTGTVGTAVLAILTVFCSLRSSIILELFFVARTPRLQSVDIVLACDTTVSTEAGTRRKMTLWLLECKSSLLAEQPFGASELNCLLGSGRAVFAEISAAVTRHGHSDASPPTLNYSVQLVNRPMSAEPATRIQPRHAAKSDKHSFDTVCFNAVSASNYSTPLFLPGLTSAASPSTYLPADCRPCEALRDQLLRDYLGRAPLEEEQSIDILP